MKQTTLNLTEEKERKYYSETDFLRVEIRKNSTSIVL